MSSTSVLFLEIWYDAQSFFFLGGCDWGWIRCLLGETPLFRTIKFSTQHSSEKLDDLLTTGKGWLPNRPILFKLRETTHDVYILNLPPNTVLPFFSERGASTINNQRSFEICLLPTGLFFQNVLFCRREVSRAPCILIINMPSESYFSRKIYTSIYSSTIMTVKRERLLDWLIW